jgi:hypothetical protein
VPIKSHWGTFIPKWRWDDFVHFSDLLIYRYHVSLPLFLFSHQYLHLIIWIGFLKNTPIIFHYLNMQNMYSQLLIFRQNTTCRTVKSFVHLWSLPFIRTIRFFLLFIDKTC